MNTHNNETSANDVIEEKQDTILDKVGEMSLEEGIKALWHLIKNVKLKYILICVFCCLSLVWGGILLYYILLPILEMLWTIIKNSASMAMGLNDWKYSYHLLDRDLVCTVPLSICVATIIGRSFNKKRFLYAVAYFISLISFLEVWDYWFIVKVGAKWYLGGVCFVVMFIVIPLLLLVRKKKSTHIMDIADKDSD